MNKPVAVLLHNIRSAHNVGSVFRTADGAGVAKVFLSGYTPQPVDQFGRPRQDIAKVALGTEKNIPWKYQKNPYAILAALRNEGWHIAAVEQDADSIDYRKFKVKKATLFILGNEVQGVSKALLKKCDSILEIPMRGKKESLNVSVAAGIILFSVR